MPLPVTDQLNALDPRNLDFFHRAIRDFRTVQDQRYFPSYFAAMAPDVQQICEVFGDTLLELAKATSENNRAEPRERLVEIVRRIGEKTPGMSVEEIRDALATGALIIHVANILDARDCLRMGLQGAVDAVAHHRPATAGSTLPADVRILEAVATREQAAATLAEPAAFVAPAF